MAARARSAFGRTGDEVEASHVLGAPPDRGDLAGRVTGEAAPEGRLLLDAAADLVRHGEGLPPQARDLGRPVTSQTCLMQYRSGGVIRAGCVDDDSAGMYPVDHLVVAFPGDRMTGELLLGGENHEAS